MWFITARGLIDFFFGYRRKHGDELLDDILAADHLPEGAWMETAETLIGTRPAEFDSVDTAANKLAAHLTYTRVDEEGVSIRRSAIAHEFILGVAAVWLRGSHPSAGHSSDGGYRAGSAPSNQQMLLSGAYASKEGIGLCAS